MCKQKYSLGIDLGTSNSAVSCAKVGEDEARLCAITQLLSPGVVGEKPLLSSLGYIPLSEEALSGNLGLPWSGPEAQTFVIGEFAKERGSLSPDRLVSSAKSWLSNNQVDRKSAVLPWRSTLEQGKVSPFEASRLYLEHIKMSLEVSQTAPSIDDCRIVLTVPASFDEAARSLTFEAASEAGLGEVTLLEEPQAAFYAWVAANRDTWRDEVSPGDIVLVCDVGGGTADFSLIAVTEEDGALQLERISVGEHILLGGDNMDLALGFGLRQKLEAAGQKLDDWQFLSLVHAARNAKERLFSDNELEAVPISVAGRGSSLFSSAVSTELSRAEAHQVVIDGFFPLTAISELPQAGRALGLQEFGLPFASDPVLSRHLAKFLTESLQNVRSDERLWSMVNRRADDENRSYLQPTAVLFNGGVFNADLIRTRVLELLSGWNSGEEVRELSSSSFDTAVSRGAAYYGQVSLSGKGLRIRAGTARSYYIGLETSMPAVPGYQPPVKGLCVVPQGTEEGSDLGLRDEEFGLLTGESVEFRFFSSPVRAGDTVGEVVANAENELEETASLRLTIPTGEEASGRAIPVRLRSVVTELGSLELWMEHPKTQERWKLEFNVRGQG